MAWLSYVSRTTAKEKADPECPHCRGTGEVEVSYDGHRSDYGHCGCVEDALRPGDDGKHF